MFHHTVVRFLILEMSNTRQLQLYSLNQSTIDYSNKTLLATVSVTDGSQAATALIGSGDRGNDFRIFSSTTNIFTYGIAVQGCPELNNTCFPMYQEISVVCYLPRAACSG